MAKTCGLSLRSLVTNDLGGLGGQVWILWGWKCLKSISLIEPIILIPNMTCLHGQNLWFIFEVTGDQWPRRTWRSGVNIWEAKIALNQSFSLSSSFWYQICPICMTQTSVYLLRSLVTSEAPEVCRIFFWRKDLRVETFYGSKWTCTPKIRPLGTLWTNRPNFGAMPLD